MQGQEEESSPVSVEEVDRPSATTQVTSPATPKATSQATSLTRAQTSSQARKRNNNEKAGMSHDDNNHCEWLWDSIVRSVATSVVDGGREVRFHLEYSSGTAAIRGTKPLSEGHHYWEILMQSAVYGTDMMVGLGTASVQMDKYRNQFCSFLGIDEESWGLSYTGQLQHGGKSQSYTNKFSQGTIIGIHLDMWRGTLTFYKNKQNLGVAYSGLQGKSLYPMVCSTAARSSMKILNAVYFPSSLQFLCCETIRRIVPKQLDVTEVMKMPPGLRNFLHNNLDWLLQPCDTTSQRHQENLEEANSLMDLVRSTLGEANDRLNDQSPSDSYDECCEGVTEFSLHCDADDSPPPLFPIELPSTTSPSSSLSSSSSSPSSEPNPKRAKDDKQKRPSMKKLSVAESKARDSDNPTGGLLGGRAGSVRADGKPDSKCTEGWRDSKRMEGWTDSERVEGRTDSECMDGRTDAEIAEGKTDLESVERRTDFEPKERSIDSESLEGRADSKSAEGRTDSERTEEKADSEFADRRLDSEHSETSTTASDKQLSGSIPELSFDVADDSLVLPISPSRDSGSPTHKKDL